MRLLILLLPVCLAACGADGAPTPPGQPPSQAAVKPGITLEGRTEIGIVGH